MFERKELTDYLKPLRALTKKKSSDSCFIFSVFLVIGIAELGWYHEVFNRPQQLLDSCWGFFIIKN